MSNLSISQIETHPTLNNLTLVVIAMVTIIMCDENRINCNTLILFLIIYYKLISNALNALKAKSSEAISYYSEWLI